MLTPTQLAAQRSAQLDSARARVHESAYDRFKRLHGVPVPAMKQLSGREVLVTADGYEWSCIDPVSDGVPVAPADAAARKVNQLVYWGTRRNLAEQELADIDNEIALYKSDDSGRYGYVGTQQLDIVLRRREWLAADIERCDDMEHRVEHDIPLLWPCEHLSRCWWGDDQPFDRYWTHSEFFY